MRDNHINYGGFTHKRKAPTRKIRKAFDRDVFKRVCEMAELDFHEAYDMELVPVDQARPADYYLFLDRGSDILSVAHLDTVVFPDERICQFLTTADGGTVAYSGALDDRSGAYTILELLPKLGIEHDVLLTVGEESGRSTAQFFETEKDYKYIIEFDRGGMDVVMYQYEDRASEDLIRAAGAKMGDGSFSDIAYLEHLGAKAFNWGIGYKGNYHGPRGHVWLDDLYQMVAYYLNFHEDNKDSFLRHVPDWRSRYGRTGSIWADFECEGDPHTCPDWGCANCEPVTDGDGGIEEGGELVVFEGEDDLRERIEEFLRQRDEATPAIEGPTLDDELVTDDPAEVIAALNEAAYRDYSTGSTHPDCDGDTDHCPDGGCKACQGANYDNGIRGRVVRSGASE